MANATIINHATKEDIPSILSLIHELAEYENATSSVEATIESLESTLSLAAKYGDAPSGSGYAKVLILRIPAAETTSTSGTQHSYADKHGNEIIGMALYFNNYSTWRSAPGIYLEDLVVRPAFRNKGYGKLLIKALARETLSIGGKRLEWACLKWNEPSLAFYRGLGAKEMVEWVGLRTDGDALEKLAES